MEALQTMRRGASHVTFVLVLILSLIFGKTVLAEGNYLTFTGTQPFTINTGNNSKNWNGKLEYSTDASNWTEWNGGIISSSNNIIYIRGKDNSVITGVPDDYDRRWVISSEGTVGCSGDIRSLLDHTNMDNTTMQEYCFMGLFYDCRNLTGAPELSATTLAFHCYSYMFYGCASLTEAPELPTTDVVYGCYDSMFYGCTSLRTAPELPATTVTWDCYNSMFYGCTSLIAAPELPATNLSGECYDSMFYGCTSLVTAPELPATTLAWGCYDGMFYGCTSLIAAPELPATVLADFCYQRMFYGCTSLTEAPKLPATTMKEWCYDSMFYGCKKLTVAPELPATTLAWACYYSMFYDCTRLTAAPELPATTLADGCYMEMFHGCTSLTTAPELPATTLAKWCYESMFRECTSLTTAPGELPAITLTESCYSYMFSGCTSLTSAPKILATTMAEWCCQGMFHYCISLTTVPGLPATILAESCYCFMFNRCYSLIMTPELPAKVLKKDCYYGMFSFCTSLIEVPELPAKTLAEGCYAGMFTGCSKIEISEHKNEKYNKEYRIPNKGEGTLANDALTEMFDSTGGPFTGTPEINRIYYVRNKIDTDNSSIRYLGPLKIKVEYNKYYNWDEIGMIKVTLENHSSKRLRMINLTNILPDGLAYASPDWKMDGIRLSLKPYAVRVLNIPVVTGKMKYYNKLRVTVSTDKQRYEKSDIATLTVRTDNLFSDVHINNIEIKNFLSYGLEYVENKQPSIFISRLNPGTQQINCFKVRRQADGDPSGLPQTGDTDEKVHIFVATLIFANIGLLMIMKRKGACK